jgi:hypothetical protein
VGGIGFLDAARIFCGFLRLDLLGFLLQSLDLILDLKERLFDHQGSSTQC